MKCYICDQTSRTLALRYNVADALGICHHCGVGVCAQHSHKEAEAGSLLLCTQCANLGNHASVAQPVDTSLKKKEPARV